VEHDHAGADEHAGDDEQRGCERHFSGDEHVAERCAARARTVVSGPSNASWSGTSLTLQPAFVSGWSRSRTVASWKERPAYGCCANMQIALGQVRATPAC